MKDGIQSVWTPASQKYSQVGQAGVCVVSMKGAPVSLPTFATSQFGAFFDKGRAVTTVLHWEVGGVCTLWSFMVIRELGMIQRPLL